MRGWPAEAIALGFSSSVCIPSPRREGPNTVCIQPHLLPLRSNVDTGQADCQRRDGRWGSKWETCCCMAPAGDWAMISRGAFASS